MWLHFTFSKPKDCLGISYMYCTYIVKDPAIFLNGTIAQVNFWGLDDLLDLAHSYITRGDIGYSGGRYLGHLQHMSEK